MKYENGIIDVHFPFDKPYNCQDNYIRAMLRALKNKDNALLESPTGTGKTLCLLSASAAFLEAYNKNPMYFDKHDPNDDKLLAANSSLPTTPTGSQDDKKDKKANKY